MSDKQETDKRPIVVLKVGDSPRAVRRIKTLLIEASDNPDCPASDKIFRRGSAALTTRDSDRFLSVKYLVD